MFSKKPFEGSLFAAATALTGAVFLTVFFADFLDPFFVTFFEFDAIKGLRYGDYIDTTVHGAFPPTYLY